MVAAVQEETTGGESTRLAGDRSGGGPTLTTAGGTGGQAGVEPPREAL